MSRSINKTPVIGYTTAESEKKSKQQANRRFRRKIKMEVQANKEEFTSYKLLNNIWTYQKDGKHYVKNLEKKYLRK